MNPWIDHWIAPIVMAPHKLLAPVTKKVVADAALGGEWINRTLRKVSWIGVNGITPVNIFHAVSVVEPPSPFLIGIFATSAPCGLNKIHNIENKGQATPPTWLVTPKNWTLLLTESCPMIPILRPFSER